MSDRRAGVCLSFLVTTMTGRTKPQRRVAPEQYPGHNLSIIEALHAVSMKLSQVDDMRSARLPIPCRFVLETNSSSSRSLTFPTVCTFELQVPPLSHALSRSNLLNKQCPKR